MKDLCIYCQTETTYYIELRFGFKYPICLDCLRKSPNTDHLLDFIENSDGQIVGLTHWITSGTGTTSYPQYVTVFPTYPR